MNKAYQKSLFLTVLLILVMNTGHAQENLVNFQEKIQTLNEKNGFIFTRVINAEASSVKDQKSTGTCWSYSTNSFLESEMIRIGKKPVDLADLFSTRNVMVDKGINYVRMHGALTLGDGGVCHDVINMLAKYGALPQEVYSGKDYGTFRNSLDRMNRITRSILEKVVQDARNKIDSNWKNKYIAAIDSCLGAVPETFKYEGHTYSAQTFAKEVVGIEPSDYISFSSFNNAPYYKQTILMVPDNWSFEKVYNVEMAEITKIIDHALNNGFTVAWETDVTEKGFSWKKGIAYVPARDFEVMSKQERSDLFAGPKSEKVITPELRQKAFDNYETTDDHGMHITGIARDQNGKEYYIVKNSWGMGNDYKGYLYVTKEYVKYKTTAFLLHKQGIPTEIRQKLAL